MIDDIKENQVMAIIDEVHYFYEDFIVKFPMCQWEAIQIAVQHEAVKELDNDMDLLRFDLALKPLKNT
jgi:hypothetical protein